MKSYVWITLLAGLMFASGLATGVVSVRVVSGGDRDSVAKTETKDRGGDRRERGGGRGDDHERRGVRRDRDSDGRRGDGPRGKHSRGSSLGPHFDALELPGVELTAEQQAEVDAAIAASTARVHEYEKKIGDELCTARRAVDAVLTDEQRESLDKAVGEMFERMREQRTTELMAWLEERTELDEGAMQRCREVLAGWMDEKGAYFRDIRKSRTWPERDEMSAALDVIADARDARLAEMLDEDTLKDFRRRADRGPRGGGRDHDRGRDGESKKKKKKQD